MTNLRDGIQRAAESIDSGSAAATLQRFVEASQEARDALS